MSELKEFDFGRRKHNLVRNWGSTHRPLSPESSERGLCGPHDRNLRHNHPFSLPTHFAPSYLETNRYFSPNLQKVKIGRMRAGFLTRAKKSKKPEQNFSFLALSSVSLFWSAEKIWIINSISIPAKTKILRCWIFVLLVGKDSKCFFP